ncbi:MAG: SLC13 family permease [Eubacteriales bacterium]|nr:SLC13 family permease [Eubacteriales bacterium]
MKDAMNKIGHWLARNPVLWIAGLLAAASCFLVPPSAAYWGYLDGRTLAILLCLMATVAGLRAQGVLDAAANLLLKRIRDSRMLCLGLTLLCFFAAMFMTNDVALLTFVPLALAVTGGLSAGQVIWIVVMQTVAANLGSAVTPFGNPQNLYLYAHYGMSLGAFFQAVLPLGAAGLAASAGLALLLPARPLPARQESGGKRSLSWRTWLYAGLFALCVAAVLRLVPLWVMLAGVLLPIAFLDTKLLARVDYGLLLTFVFFFIFVGNLSALTAVGGFLQKTLAGREVWVSALASQAVSNVPAALMLSSFTKNAGGLLVGTNIGGLGTLIASMASLISYQQYAREGEARRGRYLLVFSAVNFALLGVLLACAAIFGWGK